MQQAKVIVDSELFSILNSSNFRMRRLQYDFPSLDRRTKHSHLNLLRKIQNETSKQPALHDHHTQSTRRRGQTNRQLTTVQCKQEKRHVDAATRQSRSTETHHNGDTSFYQEKQRKRRRKSLRNHEQNVQTKNVLPILFFKLLSWRPSWRLAAHTRVGKASSQVRRWERQPGAEQDGKGRLSRASTENAHHFLFSLLRT